MITEHKSTSHFKTVSMENQAAADKTVPPNPGPVEEPIAVHAGRQDGRPTAFFWRGRRYAVRAVEDQWTVMRQARPPAGSTRRNFFRVRSEEATFVLAQDSRRHTWQLSRILA